MAFDMLLIWKKSPTEQKQEKQPNLPHFATCETAKRERSNTFSLCVYI